MRFTIPRELFLKPLRAVAGVVERRQVNQSPILANVLMEIDDSGALSLTATDQEVELISQVLLESIFEIGRITVPFRKLMDICRALPESSVLTLVLEQDKLLIRTKTSRFSLSVLPAEQFPNVQSGAVNLHFSLNQKKLRGLIERSAFAMAEQDVRYYLNGMLLEIKNNKLFSVAADGHRLALSTIALDRDAEKNKSSENIRVIVPRKGVMELMRVLDENDDTVEISFGAHHVRVVTESVCLTSKLLDGKFPDYERLIPVGGTKIVIGNREIFKEAFQRAATLFTEKFRAVRLHLSHNCLKILATNTELDEVEEDVAVEYQGEELEIGFNVKYLLDFLSIIQTEQVKFTFSDANNSALLESLSEESGRYVLMPTRT